MHVINYTLHNVMNISDLDLPMEGRNLVLIGGRNGAGKSSAIKGFLAAICGKSGMEYPTPLLKEGEEEGWVRVTLTGCEQLHEDDHIAVELHLTRKRDGTVAEAFRIVDSTGEAAPSPRTLLKSLYKAKAFDPLEFERMDKRTRRKTLMDLVGLNVDEFEHEHKKIYEMRTTVNRDADRAKGRLDAMPCFDDAPAEEIKVHELIEERERIDEHNKKVNEAAKAVTDAEKNETDAEANVKELEEKLAKAKGELEECQNATAAAKHTAKQIGEEKPVEDIAKQIKEAGEVNVKVQANAKFRDAKKDLAEIQDESAALTEKLKQLEKDQDKKMREAKWPVDGLSIDSEGVLVDGLPYESANKSKRTIVSTRIGMGLNPELRLLVCEDGSDLDPDTLSGLEQVLKEEQFQMLVEFVTRNETDEQMCAVVIEDGKAKALPGPEPEAVTA